MSEYQYYEFLAIEKPLDDIDFNWVRGISTRAEITRTHFVNTYHWGDFKGDPEAMLERCYDAFVYDSNFGTCRFYLKLPIGALNIRDARVFEGECACSFKKTKSGILVYFDHEDEPDDYFNESGECWMSQLLPIREELLAGDLRSLYIAWLGMVQAREFEAKDIEPPIPPGLSNLTAAQTALAEFLHISPALIKIAAKQSPPLKARSPQDRQLKSYLAGLTRPALERIALRSLKNEAEVVKREVLRKIAVPIRKTKKKDNNRRSVAEIYRQWDALDRNETLCD